MPLEQKLWMLALGLGIIKVIQFWYFWEVTLPKREAEERKEGTRHVGRV